MLEVGALEGLITTLAKTGKGGLGRNGERQMNSEPAARYFRIKPGRGDLGAGLDCEPVLLAVVRTVEALR